MRHLLFAALLSVAAGCGPGSEFSLDTQRCERCAVGKYRNSDTSAYCVACPDNSTTLYDGATTVAECTLCVSTAVYKGWHDEERRALCAHCPNAPDNLSAHRRTQCATPDWGDIQTYMHAGFRNLDHAMLSFHNSNKKNSAGVIGDNTRAKYGYVYQITEEWENVDPYNISAESYKELENLLLQRLEYNGDCEPLQIWKDSLNRLKELDKALRNVDQNSNSERTTQIFCSRDAIKDSLYAHVLPMHTLGGEIITHRFLLYHKKTKNNNVDTIEIKEQILRLDSIKQTVARALQYYDLRVFFTRKYIEFLHDNLNASTQNYMKCVTEEYPSKDAFEIMLDEYNIAEQNSVSDGLNEHCKSTDRNNNELKAQCHGNNWYDISYTQLFCNSNETVIQKLNNLLQGFAKELEPLLREETLDISMGKACEGHGNRTLFVNDVQISGDEANITVDTPQVTLRVESDDGLCTSTRTVDVEQQHVHRHFYHAPADKCSVAKLVNGADFSRVWEDVYRGSHVAPSLRDNIHAVLARYDSLLP